MELMMLLSTKALILKTETFSKPPQNDANEY